MGTGFKLTPEGQIAPGLFTLLGRMRELAEEMTKAVGYDSGFNATLEPAGADVSCLRLMGNGQEYSCVCEAPEGEPPYDIWERGRLLHIGLDLEPAAHFLLKAYHEAKMDRVRARNASFKKGAPLCRIEGHDGYWWTNGYWCSGCKRLYREG